MTYLLYVSYSAKLTEKEKIKIDKKILNNYKSLFSFIRRRNKIIKSNIVKPKKFVVSFITQNAFGQKIVIIFMIVSHVVFGVNSYNIQNIQTISLNTTSTTAIERVVEIPHGGDMLPPWSPRVKAAKSAKTAVRNLRGRTLPALPNSDGSSNANVGSKRLPFSVNENRPKPGNGIRVTSISKMNEEGETETTFYDKNGPITDQSAKTKGGQGLTKARSRLTEVKNDEFDRLTSDGDFVHSLQLAPKGRKFVSSTRERRTSPLILSKYEDKDKGLFPAYSIPQVGKKQIHTIQILERLNRDVEKYMQATENERLQFDIDIVERLLGHPETEVHMDAMGQGREPIILMLNRGLGDYPIPNHVATLERRPEICSYNTYISNYIAKESQVKDFDMSQGSETPYEDLFGNSQINVGPVFGKITIIPESDDVNQEL